MENTFSVNEFAIKELETVEAPLTDYQAGVVVGVAVGLELIAIGAIAAC